MKPSRVAGFFARVLLVYALLMVPWPGLADGYTSAFRWACGVFAGGVGSDGHVVLLPRKDQGLDDAMFLLVKKNSRVVVRSGLQSRYVGYLPAAIVIALVLSTPCAWRRKLQGLVPALVLIHLFVFARSALSVYSEFATAEGIALVDLGDFGRNAVRATTEIVADPISSIVAALVVWTLVMFRRGDWAAITDESTPSPAG